MRRLIFTVLAALSVTGCTPEPEVVDVTLDTTGWPRYCLGYHSFQAPPEFVMGQSSATVDGVNITVRASDPLPINQVIAAQEDFGRVMNTVEVNGWTVVVATQDNGLLESSFNLKLVGARRLGADVVVASRDISREIYPDGADPELWAWHARTTPRHAADGGSATTGYCLSGIVFDSPKAPEPRASFLTSLGLVGPTSSQGQKTMRSDADLTLQAMFYPPEKIDDARPLAAGPDISTFPGVKVEAESLSIAGRNFGFTTVRYAADGKSTHWYDAAAFNEVQSGVEPTILAIKFQNATLSEDDSRAQALAILASLRLGRQE